MTLPAGLRLTPRMWTDKGCGSIKNFSSAILIMMIRKFSWPTLHRYSSCVCGPIAIFMKKSIIFFFWVLKTYSESPGWNMMSNLSWGAFKSSTSSGPTTSSLQLPSRWIKNNLGVQLLLWPSGHQIPAGHPAPLKRMSTRHFLSTYSLSPWPN